MSARGEAHRIGPPSDVERLREALVQCREIAENGVYGYRLFGGYADKEESLRAVLQVADAALNDEQS